MQEGELEPEEEPDPKTHFCVGFLVLVFWFFFYTNAHFNIQEKYVEQCEYSQIRSN